jgi:RNA polymerase sigma-70 factor, ECF subfamily
VADRGGDDRRAAFEQFYGRHYPQIAAFVQRRVSDEATDDIVAGVFTVAWRRFGAVPAEPADRLWLFGVARHAIADHQRSQRRRSRLRLRLAQHAIVTGQEPANPLSEHAPVLAAVRSLRPADQEALRLVLWDDFSHAEAAAVLGCSVNAFELRYRRARRAVRDALSNGPPLPVPSLRPSTATERTP